MAELLQLYALAERTGTLQVTTDAGTSRVLLESGRIVGFGVEDFDVHSAIVACELMPARAGASLSSITPSPGTPGLSFIVRNLVEPERWDLFARRCVEQQIYPFLTREQGEFNAVVDRVPFCPITVSLSVQQLVLDGSRWQSEMEEHRLDGFSPDKVFARSTSPPEQKTLTSVEWLVWSILDGPQSIARIAERIGMPELDATAVVRKHIGTGWIQPA